jgi:hypothetical protein
MSADSGASNRTAFPRLIFDHRRPTATGVPVTSRRRASVNRLASPGKLPTYCGVIKLAPTSGLPFARTFVRTLARGQCARVDHGFRHVRRPRRSAPPKARDPVAVDQSLISQEKILPSLRSPQPRRVRSEPLPSVED